MADIRVDRYEVDVSSNGQTQSITDVGSLSSAFVRILGCTRHDSAGQTGSSSNAGPDDMSGAVQLTATNQLTFYRQTGTVKMMVEVWVYTGDAGGDYEFINRGRGSISCSGSSATSSALSGISDTDACIPFHNGVIMNEASNSNMEYFPFYMYLNASDQVVVGRNNSGTTGTIYYDVVEFTGSAWSVGHAKSSNHDDNGAHFTGGEVVTMNTSSTGTGGSTFDVDDWSTAMIMDGTMGGDSSETGLSDTMIYILPGTSSTTIRFTLDNDKSRNDSDAYAHILKAGALSVYRNTSAVSEGNGSYGTVTWPTGAPTSGGLSTLSLEWFPGTNGEGTAHGRGALHAKIRDNGGTYEIRHWVHRDGNDVMAAYGVADLSLLGGIFIGSVDGDDVVGNAQTNVIVSAPSGGFEASQGSGTVILAENIDGSGNTVSQSVDSWSDTSIQIDISSGALADSYCYLIVTNDSGDEGVRLIQVGVPPETYTEAVAALSNRPDHHWPFQDSYVDVLGGAPANGDAESGTSFSTDTLVKGDTHSLLLDSDSDYTNPDNQTDMNDTSSATQRYIGGWIMLDKIAKNLVVIWEEGGQVNNFAFLNGFGNSLMFQAADAGGDYSQTYTDIKLTPNRPYFILGEWNGSGQKSGDGALWLDGVKQSRSDGLPWEVSSFPSHTGSISWGKDPGSDLKVGDDRGVDATVIAFVSPNECRYAHWFSWFNKGLSDDDIRVELFEKGAPADTTISTGTESAMQTSIDAEADIEFPDWPCALEIKSCSEGDFELEFDNITFNPRASIQVRYLGSDTLTIVMKNGTVIDPDKVSTPYGGNVILVSTVLTTIEGIPSGAEWRLYEDSATPGVIGTVLLDGEESKVGTGDVVYSDQYVSDTDVVLQVIASGYEEFLVYFTLQSTAQTIVVDLVPDNNI